MSGVFWTMATPVTAEVVGLQDLASALSILWLLGTVLPTTCISSVNLHVLTCDSCGSNRLTIKAKCYFSREEWNISISIFDWIFRFYDPHRRTYFNCMIFI